VAKEHDQIGNMQKMMKIIWRCETCVSIFIVYNQRSKKTEEEVYLLNYLQLMSNNNSFCH